MKQVTTIKIRRGMGDARYCACDKHGSPIMGFNKLSDIRKYWESEIKWGHVELVRELDKTPNIKIVEETKKSIEKILRSYAN